MPEVQQSTHSGEMAQRFIELVMMQAQQTAMFLGQLPGPDGQKLEPNLPYARMFIDQIEMLQEKTRGNLSQEETQVLKPLPLLFELLQLEKLKLKICLGLKN